jgi:RND family efflux transporter MFP subunit
MNCPESTQANVIDMHDQPMSDARESQISIEEGPIVSEQPNVPPIVLTGEHKLYKRFVFGLFAVALVLLIFVYLGIRSRVHAEDTVAASALEDAIPSVAVTRPSHGANALEITLPANTQAFVDTPVYARTNGYLTRWYADIGAHVHRGDVLAAIETPELDQQVQQAQSDLETAEANGQIAQITAARWQRLLAKNAVSTQEADQTSSDLKARNSALTSAQANLRRLQQLQSFEKVYAPFDGVVTARNIDVGSLIQAGDSDITKAQLFHIASTDKLRLFVAVPEVYASAFHNGASVAITTDAFPNVKFTGKMVRNAEAIDPASRTLNVEVDVANTNHKLLPGQYAFVHLPIPAVASSTTLPSNVLLFRREGLRVGVVRKNHVELMPVVVGHDYGAKVEIISGLTVHDEVVLNPSDSLTQGQRVHVVQGDAE